MPLPRGPASFVAARTLRSSNSLWSLPHTVLPIHQPSNSTVHCNFTLPCHSSTSHQKLPYISEPRCLSDCQCFLAQSTSFGKVSTASHYTRIGTDRNLPCSWSGIYVAVGVCLCYVIFICLGCVTVTWSHSVLSIMHGAHALVAESFPRITNPRGG